MKERILGYDVREMWYEDQFDLVKQGRFKKMLSIEGALWGSIFEWDYVSLVGQEREKYGLGTLELPEMLTVGMNLPFWSDLDGMLDHVRDKAHRLGRRYWVTAITICLEDPEGELKERTEWPYHAQTIPVDIQSDWVLVGYDVTTRDSESMITPCLEPLTRGEACDFEKDLNEYMLFSNLAKADEFRRARDADYELGYPHMIYGIWRVGEIVL
ncbi:MAG: hypothetical protein M1376_11140 [Planctomycetes bacterium]|nr:hypothetical protein [Planctomycetota bacterium]